MMCAETREELEASRPMYSISFDHFHLGTTISSSLEGFEFVTDKTISSSLDGFKCVASLTKSSVTEGFNFAEKLLKFSQDNHAPFENFLKTWYYIPLTVWWKTFAPPMFSSISTFAGKAEEWTTNPLGLLACGPFLAMLKTFAKEMKDNADGHDKILSDSQKYLGTDTLKDRPKSSN